MFKLTSTKDLLDSSLIYPVKNPSMHNQLGELVHHELKLHELKQYVGKDVYISKKITQYNTWSAPELCRVYTDNFDGCEQYAFLNNCCTSARVDEVSGCTVRGFLAYSSKSMVYGALRVFAIPTAEGIIKREEENNNVR